MLGVFLFSGLPTLLQRGDDGGFKYGEKVFAKKKEGKKRREGREEEGEHVKKPQLVGALERRAFFAKNIF